MDLPTLAYRRLRSDAIETYKFPRGLYSVDLSVPLLWWKKPQHLLLLPEDIRLNYRSVTAGPQCGITSSATGLLISETHCLNPLYICTFTERFDKLCIALEFSSTL